MKKIVSLILCLCMLVGAVQLSAAAANEYRSDLPIISVVGGQQGGQPLYDENGNPWGQGDIAGAIANEEVIKDLGKYLAEGLATDNWDNYSQTLVSTVEPFFDGVRMDENGDPTGKSGIRWSWSESSLSNATGNYYTNQYTFKYDYRADPILLASRLNDYIEAVLRRTGKSQVNMFVRCLGSSVFLSYISEYGDSRVNDVVMYVPTNAGMAINTALYCGDVNLDPTAIDRYVADVLDDGTFIEDENTNAFAVVLVSLLNQLKVLGFGTDTVKFIYNKLADRLTSELCLATVGTWPCYWTMIESERTEEAIDYIFNTDELKQQYAGLIAKIRYYNENVNSRSEELLKGIEANGKRVAVIGKYGKAAVPLGDNAALDGDSFGDVGELTYGAVSGSYGQPLTAEYLKGIEGTENEKYLSPDKRIDASGCLFRDTTWFIKNSTHNVEPANLIEFINWLMHDGSRDIYSSETYPQYMIIDEQTGKFVAYTEYTEDEQVQEEDKWTNNFFKVIIRFFTRLFNLLASLFKR